VSDLQPQPAGIRARRSCEMARSSMTSCQKESDRTLHVCNAPSPAETSALPIARYITDRLLTGQ
jgi:(S)-2-hydroxyglutarate dehydrogenase